MKNDNLLKRVSALGFPLFDVEEEQDVNLTLADMVKSRDLRLWEGFPVVLANSAEKRLFDYSRVTGFLKNSSDKLYFGLLLALSLALFRDLRLKFAWADGLYELLNVEGKKHYKVYSNALQKNQDLYLQSVAMSSQRLKNVFHNYSDSKEAGFKELLYTKEELGLEYALSQVFSPKQKELFLKKLKNDKLTKTEKEYFSRTVKKKVLALANSELHRLSKELLR
ncbi:hypothetical protein EPO66_02120 [bacterium]|nr:MAG: hypothetical protein EPO66_02120 [bacterium]